MKHWGQFDVLHDREELTNTDGVFLFHRVGIPRTQIKSLRLLKLVEDPRKGVKHWDHWFAELCGVYVNTIHVGKRYEIATGGKSKEELLDFSLQLAGVETRFFPVLSWMEVRSGLKQNLRAL